MSKPNVADRATVVRSTQVRAKLKGDNSWCKNPRETEAEQEEEKPWLAEVRARRINGAPVDSGSATSPVKSTPPPLAAKPVTERAPTTGYRTSALFNQPSKPVTSSNGFSQTTQFTKKPSDTYKRIAPHTVRPTSENQGGQLSTEEQDKRTEAASNVLKKSSVRQRSYVLSAAKKFESQPPDTSVVNNTVSFVATRVEITDEDENAPVSAVRPSPAVPVTSATSVPEPSKWKTVNTSVKTGADVTVNEPVVPKASTVAPAPVKDAPAPSSVSNKDPFDYAKPGSTKVATPLPELITECIQAASSKPEAQVSVVSGEADKLLIDQTLPSKLPKWPPEPIPDDSDDDSELPAKVLRPTVSPAAASPAPVAPVTPVAPVAPVTPVAPVDPVVRVAPIPKTRTPVIPTPVAPIKVSPTPLSPAKVSPTPLAPTPLSPTKVAPTPVSRTPVAPAKVSPTPLAPTLVSPTKVSPTPVSPTPVAPTPVARTPLSTTAAVTVNTETKYEPKPVSESDPRPKSSVDTLAALSDTLISFDTTSSSIRNDEPALAKEEVGLKDTRTTESRTEQGDDDDDDGKSDDAEEHYKYDDNDTDSDKPDVDSEKGDCDGMSDDSHNDESDDAEDHYKYDDKDSDSEKSDDDSEKGDCDGMSDHSHNDHSGPEEEDEKKAEPAVLAPSSPGRWSQELLSELRSESTPLKSSGTLDLLADKVTVINSEPRSMQREEEKQTDETAKETQSLTETVTRTTETVIINDKKVKADNADPWSSSVRTTVTEWSSADPFDPYPIGTTSPNSSSDLLQPLSSISINREFSTEYQEPASEIRMSSNALESLADDVIPIDTSATRISSRRSWTRTWETNTPLQAGTGESREEEGQVENSQTIIKFERKSSENDSPWDRWTSPTVYDVTSTAEDEEQEEEKSFGESHTVTTVTTIRETRTEPEPVTDRYESYSRTVIQDEPRVPTPEPESKKGFVYVKEYVNATEMSALNSRDGLDSESDYLSSSSLNYGYGNLLQASYSRAPLSSSCTYCGKQVGDDSKITIEHLGINCHPTCFECDACKKPMGDLLHSMFIHGGKVHCEECYAKV